jgi:hypothetical protein
MVWTAGKFWMRSSTKYSNRKVGKWKSDGETRTRTGASVSVGSRYKQLKLRSCGKFCFQKYNNMCMKGLRSELDIVLHVSRVLLPRVDVQHTSP